MEELIVQLDGKTAAALRNRLPKNYSEYTFSLIWNYVKEQRGTVSAEFVARRLGVSRTTARRYLEYCLEEGMMERVMVFHGLGRPKHHFRIKRSTRSAVGDTGG